MFNWWQTKWCKPFELYIEREDGLILLCYCLLPLLLLCAFFFPFIQFQWLSNTRSSARVNLNWFSILANQKHIRVYKKYNNNSSMNSHNRITIFTMSIVFFAIASITHPQRYNGYSYSQIQISILLKVFDKSQAIELRFRERKKTVN